MSGRYEIARTNPPREVREAMDAAERATRDLAWKVRQALVAEPPGTLTDAGRVAAWRAGRNRVVAQVLDVLDAAGTPADGDQRHNMPRQFTPPAVTDAMVRAAEVAYALHPGTPSGATKRASIRAALEAALAAGAPAPIWPEITDADEADFDQTLTEEGLRPALEAFAAEIAMRLRTAAAPAETSPSEGP